MSIKNSHYKECRYCGNEKLEGVVKYNDYPIFIGCSDGPLEDDETYNFEVKYCSDCGNIQQINLPPLEILYRENRAFGLGKVWQGHYDNYFNFINNKIRNHKKILEIGGGNGLLLKRFLETLEGVDIYDLEPNPQYEPNKDITTIKKYLTRNEEINLNADIIYSSHLVEHLEDINEFFEKSKEILSDDGLLFTACPNIIESFKNNHLNSFTTDHFNYFNPSSLAFIAKKHGFFLNDYVQYRDHSMYLCFSKDISKEISIEKNSSIKEYRSFRDRLETYIKSLERAVEGDFYLFGAHAFTITFLNYFPKGHDAVCVLDNESTKQNRRLCGTQLICKSPEVLREIKAPNVILYMGAYTDEISKQLFEINPATKIWKFSDIK